MTRPVLAALLLALLVCGCGRSELKSRYLAERALWRTDHEADRIAIRPELFDEKDRRAIIDRYLEIAKRYRDPAPGENAPHAAHGRREVAAAAFLRAAELSSRLGDTLQAAETYRTVERDFPDVPLLAAEATFTRGLLSERAGNTAEALAAFDTVVAGVEPDLDAGGIQAAVLPLPLRIARTRARGESTPEAAEARYEPAIAYYRRLMEEHRGERLGMEARFHLIDALTDLRRWDDAIANLEAAEAEVRSLDAGGRDPAGVRYALAQAERMSGDPDRSRETYLSVVDEFPRSAFAVRALLALGTEAAGRGDTEAALGFFHRLRSEYTSPEDLRAEAMLRSAKLLEKDGRWPRALELLRAIPIEHPLTPQAVRAPLEVVAHYEDAGDEAGRTDALAEAEKIYRGFLDRFPDVRTTPLVRDRLVVVLILEARFRDAVDELDAAGRSLRGTREGAAALLRAADLAVEELGDTTRAVVLLDQVKDWYEGSAPGRLAEERVRKLRGESS